MSSSKRRSSIVQLLRPWLAGSWSFVLASLTMPVLAGLAVWAAARVSQNLLNAAANVESVAVLDISLYVLLAFLGPALGAIGTLGSTVVGRRLELGSEHGVLGRTLDMQSVEPYNTTDGHDVIGRAVEGVRAGSSQSLGGIATVLQSVTTVAAFSASLFFLERWIAGLLVGVALANLMLKIQIQGEAEQLAATNSEYERRRFYTYFLLTASAYVKELRLFSFGRHIHSKLLDASLQLESTERLLAKRRLVRQSVLFALDAVVTAVVVMFLVDRISKGLLPPGDLLFYLAAVNAMQSGFEMGITAIANLFDASRYFRRYSDFEDLMDQYAPPTNWIPIDGPIVSVKMEDVWFRYGSDGPWVLRAVNLHLSAPCRFGLVGDNGSGKSTLISLLLGLYTPTRGRILVNGVDLEVVNKSLYRDRLSALFQDFGRYELTVEENVAGGRHADSSEIEAALTTVGVKPLVDSLPQKLGTHLGTMFNAEGEAGIELSGGQWQLLAAARAVYGDAELIVLDEPTSAMDASAEANFLAHVLTGEGTAILLVVSHRMNIILDLDSVIVLDQGSVKEIGKPKDLLYANGYFAERFAIQTKPIRKAMGWLEGRV